jgi:carbon dioxide concentrating mechanism protein CcmN
MYLPPLQAINHADLYQTGDVTVDPSAIVGLGVILQAAPNCRIAIGAGACLGMGTILNACEGIIEIEAGAVLGAGVLMVGQGKVGANASIGAVSTIFNASIEPMQVLAAGSVLGNIGAKVVPPSVISPNESTGSPVDRPKSSSQNQEKQSSQTTEILEPSNSSFQSDSMPSSGPVGVTNHDELPLTTDDQENSESTTGSAAENSDEQLANGAEAESAPTPGSPIYGQVYVSRMLGTIFPNGESIKRRDRKN